MKTILLIFALLVACVAADHCVPTPELEVCIVKGDYVSSSAASSGADLSLRSSLNFNDVQDPKIDYGCAKAYAELYCSIHYPTVTCSSQNQIATPLKVCRAACTRLQEACSARRPLQLERFGTNIEFPDCDSDYWGDASSEEGCGRADAKINPYHRNRFQD